MALQLALLQSITNYTSLTLSDASGEYSSTNLTGWGAPNVAISAINYAHLLINTPSDVDYDFDLVADLLIDYGGAATYEDLVFNITSVMLGETTGALIPDGIYTIEYRVSTDSSWVDGAATNYTVTAAVMTYYEIQQDVYNRVKLLPQYYTCSSCNNAFLNETMLMWGMLQALIASTQYSNSVRFTEIHSALTDILAFDESNCSSCNC